MKNKYQPSSTFKSSVRLFIKFYLCIGITIFAITSGFSQQFPDGFTQTSIVKTLDTPTAMAFAPDGRIFVAEQGQGAILRVIKNGNLLPEPAIEIEPETKGNKSIIGITFDPNFRNNQYIYLYYIIIKTKHARVSRFKIDGDIIQKESEEVIVEIDEIKPEINHNGGQIQFGIDGKLYIATGDLYKPEQAQDLNNYHGKIIRVNPDGSVPSDNPFTGADDSEQKKRIWAYGIRNGFSFDIQPGTGKLFINDVGSDYYEEINDATKGGLNFGWPAEEGPGKNPDYVSPLYSYQRILEPGNDHGCAITGGVFFNPATTNYPASYKGKYIFQEYCNGWIAMLDLNNSAVKVPFATDLGSGNIYLTVGTDGNLYYLSRNGKNSILYKITYTQQEAPQITNQPDDITVAEGQSTSFTVSASGTATLQYQWQKNGKDIPGATAAKYAISKTKPQDAGQYRVIVTNTAGSVTSRAAILSVTTNNDAPVAVIITPTAGSKYQAGQVLSFEGSATDEEDGELPDSAFTWDIVFHHNTHTHEMPVVSSGKKKGTFVIPNTGEPEISVWYRLYLTVKDSKGASHKIYRDIYPRTSVINFATEPAGLAITFDGKPLTTPTSIDGVEGILRSIGTAATQSLNGKEYIFDRWKHGGSRIQTIAFPEDNLTYTAVFKRVDTPDDLVKVNINFQPSSSTTPTGYLADIGEVFANRANGFSYGWNQTTFYARDRYPMAGYDRRYLTLNHMQKIKGSDAIWEIALPDGTYQVTVVCSDPLYTNQINHLLIENQRLSDEDRYDEVDEYEVTVEVTDGRLTIKPAPDAVNAKISFVDIMQVSAGARVASAGKLANLQMEVFPNPVSDKLSVKLFTSQAGQVKLTLTDVLSRPVQGQLYQLEQGEHMLSLPVHSLKAGSYLLQISTPSHSFSKRITIVK
ncbi:T9SS type A sorting domain-containing protein [Rhodocytophaga rosea]|uniref:T9SS type A sorting domain-containing protein n=1 Tax=Rhodocytophaga rosea TaxID=2704465 RepID=A0A6C0GM95_9BACT|nr:PQQ-dependent sugar dehydrogenase [Rhodocytophaga rosea]QHT69191.1 T9SS type A sorting domain-containing protein [Rhodocytophaga rosea]